MYLTEHGSIELADAHGHLLRSVPVPGSVRQMRIDPTSQVVLAAMSDGTLLRWSIPDLRQLAELIKMSQEFMLRLCT